MVVNEIELDASLEDAWAAVATPRGREAWVEPGREVVVESAQPPGEDGYASGRITWWWSVEGEAPRHVELLVVAAPAGSRVIAIEAAPASPLRMQAIAGAFTRA